MSRPGWKHTPEAISKIVAARRCRVRIEKLVRSCGVCGIEILVWPGYVKHGKGLYCSRHCADIGRRGSGNPFAGRSHSEKTKALISKARIGKASGPNNHNWCGGVTLQTGRKFFTPMLRRKWMDSSCVRCGTAECLELDHIVPVFAGGKTVRSNIQTLCGTCNKHKFQHEDRLKYQRR